ncbi:MazG nucleotide pyrophosphohydrolase domain-containing protein [Halogranum rubrum]|uniref:NTP pyrophosphohydrolase MazG-like domain-containing protein n=1 Tax=Halogranum salarium B-1 TaxID=1210908 RepID=J2ZHJ3_9EURY|nr:MazG nucleotide pyrophosphohydrolase domain-containing protein [Halogranum salarium]EJN60160.1 hypothetical protein HSB1_07630 [Halogranum salarium B-1]
MDEQRRVARFLDESDLRTDPAYRLLDLTAEVGELAADATTSSEYGASPDSLTVNTDELGDALFALLALADELDLDAGDALTESLAKYERRAKSSGSVDSGE